MATTPTSVLVTDKGGKTLKLKQIADKYYTTFEDASLENAFTFKARPDDIIICAYPKCGTHWSHEIIRFLLAGSTDLPLQEKMGNMVEFAKPSHLDELASPRLLNTHYHFEKMSPEVFRQKSKVIYINRDPRDVAVSFFNHHRKFTIYYDYHGEWKDYFNLFLDGTLDSCSWMEYTKGWEKGIKENPDQPCLVLAYEDLIQEPLREIKKIAEYIGVKASDEFLEEVVAKTKFDSMAARRKAATNVEFVNSKVVYRKGKVGDWKDTFTVNQLETFNELFEKEMAGTNAYSRYSHAK